MPLTKQELEVVNQTNFPNNNTGYISPLLLRDFNTDVIDNTVNQTIYNTDSSSVSAQLVGLNLYTQSLNTNFITSGSLNAATASLSASLAPNINNKTFTSSFIAYTSSTNARIDTLETKAAFISQSNNFEQDNYFEQMVYIGEDLRIVGGASITGSLIVAGNITGSLLNITDNSLLGRNINTITRVSGSLITDILIIDGENFNDFSQSVVNGLNSGSAFPAFSASVDSRLDSLEAFSSSLTDTFASDAELNASSSTLQGNINRKLDTSSFNSYSASAFSQSLFVSSSFSSSLSLVSSSFSSSLSLVSQSVSGTINILSTSVNSRLNTIEVRYATTGSNSFVGNQSITGSLSVTQNIQTSGSTGHTTINEGAIYVQNTDDSFNTQILSADIQLQINTGDIIGMTPSASANNGLDGTWLGASIYTAYDGAYRPMFGFQTQNTWTDGRITALKPLVVSGSLTITSSLSVKGASSFSGSLNVLSGSSSGSVVTNVGDIYSSSAAVQKIISLTSTEYTALTPKDSNTLYIII
jgi:hypothetical protein